MKRKFKKDETVFVFNYLEPDLCGFGKVLQDTETDNAADIVLVQVNRSGETEETADRIYKLAENVICRKCGCAVCHEHEEDIDYPYYCPDCDENLYSFEADRINPELYTTSLTASIGRFINTED